MTAQAAPHRTAATTPPKTAGGRRAGAALSVSSSETTLARQSAHTAFALTIPRQLLQIGRGHSAQVAALSASRALQHGRAAVAVSGSGGGLVVSKLSFAMALPSRATSSSRSEPAAPGFHELPVAARPGILVGRGSGAILPRFASAATRGGSALATVPGPAEAARFHRLSCET